MSLILRDRCRDAAVRFPTGCRHHENGHVVVSSLVPDAVKIAVAVEAHSLLTRGGVRHDAHFTETGDTPRRMRNVRNHEIDRHGSVIPLLYGAPVLRYAFAEIVGEPVHLCLYRPERYVTTCLEREETRTAGTGMITPSPWFG